MFNISSDEFILNFAPTGVIPTKADNSRVPLSRQEIVDDVLMAAELGASIVHLHARDEVDLAPTLDPETYGLIVEAIRKERQDLIICLSLSGRNGETAEERARPLLLKMDTKPDMASLTLSSLNFAQTASINSPNTIRFLAERMQEYGVMPELEAFDIGMANYIGYLLKKKCLPEKLYINVILGNIAGAQASPGDLGAIKSHLPPSAYWSCGGIGSAQMPSVAMALASGGGVRIGMEDNLWLDRQRSKPATNRTLLKKVLQMGDALGRKPANPRTTREALGLLSGNGEYGVRPLVTTN